MALEPGPPTIPVRPGPKRLIALLALVLILLPLYLWPLHGALSSLPGALALSGSPNDPRNPAALAALPADVWDALMGRTPTPPSSPPQSPSNLTMISTLHGGESVGVFDGGTGGALSLAHLAPPMSNGGSTSDGTERDEKGGDGKWASDGSLPSSSHFLGGSPGTGPGGGGAPGGFGSGGSSGFSGLGPIGGGGFAGSGSGGPVITWDPGDPIAPTPEPGTVILVGPNLVLLVVLAWRRGRVTRIGAAGTSFWRGTAT